MARQLLTIVLVLFGIMLLMRSCERKAPSPDPVLTEPVAAVAPEHVTTLARGDTTVRLARDGSVISIEQGGRVVVRPVSATRRPFHVFLRFASGATRGLPAEQWSVAALADGGHEFTYVEDGFVLVKRVRLAGDGRGLELALRMEGASEDTRGLVVTAASGVPLSAGAETVRTAGFWEIDGAQRVVAGFRTLADARQEASPQEPARRYVVRPKEQVARIGIAGDRDVVALENLPAVSEINLDAFRCRREDANTPEIEAWLDVLAPPEKDAALERAFVLRWAPRDEAGAVAPWLAERLRAPEAETVTLENGTFRIELTELGACIVGASLKRYSTQAGEPPSPETWVPILHDGVPAGERALTLSGSAELYGIDPAHEVWEARRLGPDAVEFTLETARGFRFRKRVTLPAEDRFTVGVEVEVLRPGSERRDAARYSLVGPAGPYVEDAFRGSFIEPPEAAVLERSGGDDETVGMQELHDDGPFFRKYDAQGGGLLRAVCLRGSYFVTALRLEGRDELAGPVRQVEARAVELTREVERPDGSRSNQSMLGRVFLESPFAEDQAVERFGLYLGPTATGALKEAGIDDAVDFGFFGMIGRGLMGLMKLLASLVGSYGLAIMLMTVCVRAVLLPVSYKTQLSMQRYQKRIQKIKPLLDEVTKKYEKDPQKLNVERMKIMREHKVGLPLGCLMMFFQIPIWFALFQALRVEFALRHESFLWATDLSMPDRLFSLGFWPHEFNLFPVLMLVLWTAQQRLAPTAQSDDPQVQMQMKMMRFMPFVFFFFLYNYAAALAVYMCVSSAWSIGESKLVRRAINRMEG